MKVVVHKRFTRKQQKAQDDYALAASEEVARRFHDEINEAIKSIIRFPDAAGHLIPRKFPNGIPHRRINLKKFPFFIIYAYEPERLTFLWLRPSRSNPQSWFRHSAEP